MGIYIPCDEDCSDLKAQAMETERKERVVTVETTFPGEVADEIFLAASSLNIFILFKTHYNPCEINNKKNNSMLRFFQFFYYSST